MSQRDGILVWSNPQDWNSAVHRFLRDCVPQDVRLAIGGDPHEYFDSNQLKWLGDRPVRYRDNQEIPGLRELVEEFQQTYPRIRMFHGCRTEDVGSYFRDGFRTLDSDKQIQKARSIFLSSQFPQITDEHIVAAARELNRQGRQNILYFCLDDVHLITWAGHYLVYGSEYLSAMAASLSSATGIDLMGHLRNTGIPTIFVCDVPHSFIQQPDVVSLLIDIIIRTIDEPYALGQKIPSIDFTFEFYSSLPASVITSHYHPVSIPDRVAGGIYTHDQPFCPFCCQRPN